MQSDKAGEILDISGGLLMQLGYNGFSFRDVADKVGIKSASIHYHYPTKAGLVEAVARSYREAFSRKLRDLEGADALDLLREYGNLFVSTLKDQGGVCLGGVLAVDAASLPEQVRNEVQLFFATQHEWVSEVVHQGQESGEIRSHIDPKTFAATFVSGLEGAMMVSRALQNTTHLEKSLDQLIRLITK